MAGLGVLPWVCLFVKWVLISCGLGCFVVGLGVWPWVGLFAVVLWLWNGFCGCTGVEIVYIISF